MAIIVEILIAIQLYWRARHPERCFGSGCPMILMGLLLVLWALLLHLELVIPWTEGIKPALSLLVLAWWYPWRNRTHEKKRNRWREAKNWGAVIPLAYLYHLTEVVRQAGHPNRSAIVTVSLVVGVLIVGYLYNHDDPMRPKQKRLSY